jgi:cell division protein FtsB
MSTAAGPASAPRPRPRATPGPLLFAVVAHRRIPRLPFLLLTLAVIAAGVLGLVSLNVGVNQQAFAIARLERDNRAAAARYTSLQADVDRLKAPDRIARAAKARGMVPAGRPRVASWPGSRAGATASPGAATSPAAPGARLAGGDDPAGWSLGDDPFPLKRYLAEP